MKSQEEMKSQKEKLNLKKKKKKWKENIFRTQKFLNSINISVRQSQYQMMSGYS